jgi:hypothetical protein
MSHPSLARFKVALFLGRFPTFNVLAGGAGSLAEPSATSGRVDAFVARNSPWL